MKKIISFILLLIFSSLLSMHNAHVVESMDDASEVVTNHEAHKVDRTKHKMHKLDHEVHDKHKEHMHGMYGRYPMTREASGTSWVPDSSPMEGIHFMRNDWMLMLGGFSYLIYDHQGGKLGGEKVFDENMLMFMAQRDFGQLTWGFRTMFSLEPITIGKCGYPLLLQTGETCDGITPLINRQHPHDLFMELATTLSYSFNKDSSGFLYFALPGEPALGPPIFMMRFSGEYIPESPLGHHWMDSTHITFGVITAGLIYKGLKLEGSTFKGREPDENRFGIESPKFDSYSLRLSMNPDENLALQASYAYIKSPEQLHPDVNVRRLTASAIYNKNFDNDSNLQASAILGVNDNKPGNILPAFLFEATFEMRKKHLVFGRFEILKNDELLEESNSLAGQIFTVKKATFGYIYEFITGHLKWGLGGLIDFPMVPNELNPIYGNTLSYMIFLQVRLV